MIVTNFHFSEPDWMWQNSVWYFQKYLQDFTSCLKSGSLFNMIKVSHETNNHFNDVDVS